MIVPSYGLTCTERVLPKLALDFTTGVLDPRVTITRALNTATRINSSGLIEIVNADLPRFSYAPVSLVSKGLLIEETRTNVLLQSSDFDNIAWKNNSPDTPVVTSNNLTAPDGTMTGDTLTAISGTSNSRQSVNVLGGVAYTFSFFLKQGTSPRTRVLVRDATNGTNFIQATQITWSGGIPVIGGISAGTWATPELYANDWWRIVATGTPGNGASVNLLTGIFPDTLDQTKNIGAWGAQLEAGTFATSYIPTTTTSLSRNADVVSMTGTNFSDWWVATNGSAAVRYAPAIVSGTRPAVQFDDNTSDNIIALRSEATNPELYIKATTDQAQIDAGTIAANTNYSLCGAWNTDNCAASINGAAAITDTSATIPTVTQARLGSDGTNYLNGWLQSIRYWPQRLTDAEVQAFSKL